MIKRKTRPTAEDLPDDYQFGDGEWLGTTWEEACQFVAAHLPTEEEWRAIRLPPQKNAVEQLTRCAYEVGRDCGDER